MDTPILGYNIDVIYFASSLNESRVANIPGAKKQIKTKELTMEQLNELARNHFGYEVKIKE